MGAQTDGSTLLADIDAGSAPAIVDVRSRMEFLRGHVPGAIHVPFWLLPWRLGSLPARPTDPVVVYCGHGPRAWWAARVLGARGFSRVMLLRGHFSRWRKAGLREQR